MDFKHLDKIYNLLLLSKYNELNIYNKDDIEIVLRLRFPNLNLPTYCVKEVRLNASTFRKNILLIFDNRCALTNIISDVCEAAHILPYNQCVELEKYNKHNGILLSANMHKAFDKHYFTIDETTCKVKILFNNISDNIDLIDINLENINNMYIKQLDNKESKDFLQKRNKSKLILE